MQADYLVVGAGAMGLAFADVLATESDASLVIVDRRDQPGGHWNDAYPFVRLHQPSSFYGVNSRPLGKDRIDARGWNRGMYELAGKSEVCAYYDQVMRGLLDTGRVQYFPMCEYEGEGRYRSLVSGQSQQVDAGTVVDATYMDVRVPSTTPPAFEVGNGAHCSPPNELSRLAGQWQRYVVIGAGKTGMDACLFLLAQGLDPDLITWIKPREAWLWDRANVQAGDLYHDSIRKFGIEQFRTAAESDSPQDLFARASAAGLLVRVDENCAPTMFRCATVSQDEIRELRRIRNVVRLGRVRRLQPGRIELEHGTLDCDPDTLHIDCTADGLAARPARPVFSQDEITLQSVRTCQQVFSAAFIGHVEVVERDLDRKNLLCTPVPHPNTDGDYLRTLLADIANGARWSEDEALMDWLKHARLDFSSHRDSSSEEDLALAAQLQPLMLAAADKLLRYLG